MPNSHYSKWVDRPRSFRDEWWYWWRLIDKIAKVDDVAGAAKIIAKALDIRTSS